MLFCKLTPYHILLLLLLSSAFSALCQGSFVIPYQINAINVTIFLLDNQLDDLSTTLSVNHRREIAVLQRGQKLNLLPYPLPSLDFFPLQQMLME